MQKPIYTVSFHCACGYGPVMFSFNEARLWQCPQCLKAVEIKIKLEAFGR